MRLLHTLCVSVRNFFCWKSYLNVKQENKISWVCPSNMSTVEDSWGFVCCVHEGETTVLAFPPYITYALENTCTSTDLEGQHRGNRRHYIWYQYLSKITDIVWPEWSNFKLKKKKIKIQNIVDNYFGRSIQEHSSKMKSRENY